MKLSKTARVRLFKVRTLLLWSWFWIPALLLYAVLRTLSLLGDWSYKAAEWLNDHPPKWVDSATRRVREMLREKE